MFVLFTHISTSNSTWSNSTKHKRMRFDLREERIAWKFLRTSVLCAPQSFLFIDNGYRWQPFGIRFVHFCIASIIYACAPTNYVPRSVAVVGGGGGVVVTTATLSLYRYYSVACIFTIWFMARETGYAYALDLCT